MKNFGFLVLVALMLSGVAGKSQNVISGIGGDGKVYTGTWNGGGELRPSKYTSIGGGNYFVEFTLNNNPFPTAGWGVNRTSWTITSQKGCTISGIGGDGKIYTGTWSGRKELRPSLYSDIGGGKFFVQFTLDNQPFPEKGWGVDQTSLTITCQ